MNELIVFEFTKDRELFELVKTVSTRLNTPAYVVGGYVRDLIMGNESKDIDITLVGNSKLFCEEMKREMEKLGDVVKISVYETYGTVSLSSKLFGEVEFVTARNESYSRESRNPECTPGTLEEDLRRRDFTINAMAISLNEGSFGELVDMFSGYEDLEKKIIRTPIEPEETFIDDPLRMLRAIRFAAKYGFTIDEKTYSSICESAYRIRLIVKERVESELSKILYSQNPGYGISLLNKSGIIHYYMCGGISENIIKSVDTDSVEARKYRQAFFYLKDIEMLFRCLDRKRVDALTDNCKSVFYRLLWAKFIGSLLVYGVKDKDNVIYDDYYFVADKLGHSTISEIKKEWDLFVWFADINASINGIMKDSEVREMCFSMGKDAKEIINVISLFGIASPFRINKILESVDKFEKDGILKGKLDISGNDIREVLHLKPSKIYGTIKDLIYDEVISGRIKNTKEDIKKYLENEILDL